jgi:predicted phosphoribosyltransferase
MEFNLKKVAEFVRNADTEELLNRVTVYRAGMEPAALDLMELELDRRGVTREEIAQYNELHTANVVFHPDGTAVQCGFCSNPAIIRARGWHKIYGLVPVFPRYFAYCKLHAEMKKLIPPHGQ